jgi:hypothetical protein
MWGAPAKGRAVAKKCHEEPAEPHEERLRAKGLTVGMNGGTDGDPPSRGPSCAGLRPFSLVPTDPRCISPGLVEGSTHSANHKLR